MEAETRDAIQILTHDHREVEELFAKLEKVPAGDQHRRELADEITVELVRHSVAEEAHLYPTVAERVAGGRELADKEIAEHAKVEQLLKDLEKLEVTDASFDSTLKQLQNDVSEHVEDEEQRLFPQLRGAVTVDELAELGKKISRTKAIGPTRPHPSAPDTPPWNKILGPGVGLVDRARDAFSGRKH
jgi:hemerythrin superfamily protein